MNARTLKAVVRFHVHERARLMRPLSSGSGRAAREELVVSLRSPRCLLIASSGPYALHESRLASLEPATMSLPPDGRHSVRERG
jgi:hypothetical protein